MDTFTASNGVEIVWQPYALVIRVPERPDFTVPLDRQTALREFFLAERDAELGRWRHPEHSTFFVYEREGGRGGWLILDELTGNSKHYAYRIHTDVGNSMFSRVARDYFDAHPEPEPRPWEEAQHDEVWALTTQALGERAYQVVRTDEAGFRFFLITDEEGFRPGLFPEEKQITAGRRVWPEVKS